MLARTFAWIRRVFFQKPQNNLLMKISCLLREGTGLGTVISSTVFTNIFAILQDLCKSITQDYSWIIAGLDEACWNWGIFFHFWGCKFLMFSVSLEILSPELLGKALEMSIITSVYLYSCTSQHTFSFMCIHTHTPPRYLSKGFQVSVVVWIRCSFCSIA